MSHVDVSVISPFHCEQQGILFFVAEVLKSLQTTSLIFEIILVDDGSTDQGWALVVELAKQMPQVKALRLSRNFGKEAAVCAGMQCASGKCVVVLDSDLQHPPSLMPEMIRLWQEEHFEIVECQRNTMIRSSGLHSFGAKAFYSLMAKASGFDMEQSSDFKLLDRKVVDAFLKFNENKIFFKGIVSILGFKKCGLFFDVPARPFGVTSWSTLQLVRYAFSNLTSFSSVPLDLIWIVGALFVLASIGLGGWVTINTLLDKSKEGFPTVILLQLFIGGVVMFSLGLIGIYVAKIFDEVKRRPRFFVSESVGFEPLHLKSSL